MTANPLAVIADNQEAAIVPPSLDQARQFIRASKAANTLRGYQSGLAGVHGWAEAHGAAPLPARQIPSRPTLPTARRRLKPGTIQRRLNAIAEAHKAAGLWTRPRRAGRIVREHAEGDSADARDRDGSRRHPTHRRYPRYGGRHGLRLDSARATGH